MTKNETLVRELTTLINKLSRENESNTPDFILADFLVTCLGAFEYTTNRRQEWRAAGPIVCGEPTMEDVIRSRDEWKRQAYEQQREAGKWRNGHAQYKKALGKCADDLIKALEEKQLLSEKLNETRKELNDLKAPHTPKNFAHAIADVFGGVADIIGKQKRREAEALKKMAQDEPLEAAEDLGKYPPGYAKGGFHWEPGNWDDNAAPEYYGAPRTANGHVGFYWESKREQPRPPFPEQKKPRK